MPHSAAEQKRALTRVRRLKGQLAALERAIAAGSACADVLQQVAAVRGGVNGLMAQLLESHLREGFAPPDDASGHASQVAELVALVRTYFK